MKRFTLIVVALAAVWWVVVYPYVLGILLPPSMFVTNVTFIVQDTTVGTSPRISLTRTIRRDFDATFRSVVRIDNPAGSIACEGNSGPVHSVRGSKPPPNLTLKRWLGRESPCPLEPGRYVVVGDAYIGTPWWGLGAEVRLPIVSNIFTVRS